MTCEETPIDLYARQKAGKWGHEKGWAWVSRERLEQLCTRHGRRIVRRMFFGRRVTVVEDFGCKRRAMIRRSQRRPARVSQPDVRIPYKPWNLKP